MSLAITMLLGLIGEQVEPKVIADMVEAAATARDFTLEYEGAFIFPREEDRVQAGLGESGIQYHYSGIYATIPRQAEWSDIFRTDTASGKASRRSVLLKGDSFESYSWSDRGSGIGTIVKADCYSMTQTSLFGQVYLAPSLILRLRNSPNDIVDHESTTIDEHRCERFSFRPKEVHPDYKDSFLTFRYWVDLARGGHVIRYEIMGGERLGSRTSIELGKFKDKAGKDVWIPISGNVEGYTEDGEKVNLQTFKVTLASVRVNQGLRVGDLSIRYKPGAIISDSLQKAIYEFGQDRRPPPKSLAEVESRLKEQLDDAEAQALELKATPEPPRGIFGVLGWAPIALISIAGLALVGIWIARRLQA